MSRRERLEAPLSLRGVSKTYSAKGKPPFEVFSNVNLDIQAGDLVSVIGPSGCGKSTLLRIVSGLDAPTEGAVFVGDDRVEGPDRTRGFVFQEANLFPWDDVWHNVAAGLVARRSLAGNEHVVDDYIEMVGLQGFEKAYPKELSGGMAQRVALARALINRPNVLLLDEPLGALDALTRMMMQDEILRIWGEQKTTVMLVTHDIDEAVYMSDCVVVMLSNPGRVAEVIDIDLPRPRDRSDVRFDQYRHMLLDLILSVHSESVSPEER